MTFKRKSENKFIRAHHSIGMGIMDAIEKDHLKEVSMYILRKGTQEPLETYNIKIKYNKEDTRSDQKPAKVKEATVEFLKAFTELPGKKLKQEHVELFVELSYNEDTPREYEPPNFEAAKETLSSKSSSKFVSLGKINTGFHKISAWGRGNNFAESRASTPLPTMPIDGDDDDTQNTLFEDEAERSTGESVNKAREREPPAKKRKLDTLSLSNTGEVNCETVSIASSADYVSCLCNWDLPEEYETVRCTKCYGIVHVACHGFMSPKAIDKDKFTCFACSDNKYAKVDLNMVIKLRVILYGIYIHKSIPDVLQMASKDERYYILEQLEKFGVRSTSSTSIQDIDMKGLNKAIQLVFQTENSQYLE